jgi:hypothetical protein
MTARQLATRPHPDDRIDPDKSAPQMMRHEAVNIAESPIAWLSDIRWRVMWAGERIAGAEKGLGWPSAVGQAGAGAGAGSVAAVLWGGIAGVKGQNDRLLPVIFPVAQGWGGGSAGIRH